MEPVANVLFFARITVMESKFSFTKVDEIYWDGFSMEQYKRWSWYFRYRAALLQIKYPKMYVDFTWGNYKKPDDVLLQNLENRILSAKRKITEFNNKLNAVKINWSELFPIETDIRYINTVNKIKEKEFSLIQLQNERDELKEKIKNKPEA